ncbi:MAG: tetratricopeptide repeat protein [Cyanobacteriota bacterium]|nr:tetratricopeptide repeat protein [Cyanobacteriota bacterium]
MSADLAADRADGGPQRIGQLWCALRQGPLETRLWLELSQCYGEAGLAPQGAYARRQVARLNPAPGDMRLVTRGATEPAPTPAAAEEHLCHPTSPEAQRWARALDTWLEVAPGDWLSRLYRCRLADGASGARPATPGQVGQVGQVGQAQDDLREAIAAEPIPGESLHWLGLWRLNGGEVAGAIAALSPLVEQHPPRHGSMLYLGEALLRVGNRPAAELAFTRASSSTNPTFLRLLAQRVFRHNYWREAIAVLQRADALQPDNRDTLFALAQIHWEVYELSAAEALFRRVLELDPDHAEVRYLLNALPGRRGDAAAQLATLEAYYAELGDPGSRLASSIAMASLYVDNRSPEAVARLHRRLCAPIEAAAPLTERFDNDPDPERPLRIGLVSGDFHRQHPVNLFMVPLLERLDRDRYPVSIYHMGTMHDEDTVRARTTVAHWIEAGTLDAPALRQRIHTDGIDILIDLAGHTSSHRLGVFALRAAPVQATFLGYPHSTGLSRIDWLIGDPVVSPAAHAQLFSEGIAQLPGSVFCWCPVDDYPLPPPRPAEAPLVFGSFNNIMKLSPRTIRLWAAVLRDLPQARLLLKAPSLGDGSVVERFRSLFAAEGIRPERLLLEGPEELGLMMERYGAIDIALDPTPYNGGTTTLQALWMGVPVIALRGGNFVSRMGASFLTTLGRPEWIADDAERFRAIARQLADQLPALRQGRSALRTRMAESGLADLERYTANFEQLLRRMWRHHVQHREDRLLTAEPAEST